MPTDYHTAMAFRRETRVTYTPRDCCFYALSIGFAADPLDERALDFVLEDRGPITVPTMAVVQVPSVSRDIGLDVARLLHGEQRLALHRPLPAAANLTIESRVIEIVDKGAEKGAIVTWEAVAREDGAADPLFTLTSALFARGDGGIGGPAARRHRPPAMPETAPDETHLIETRPEQALYYRLNRDLNPLHADPATARRAGFPRPILHGLASYGNAARALVSRALDHDAAAITSFDARFTTSVFPGETIAVDVWRAVDHLAFRVRVPDRGVTCLDNGYCGLR